MKPKQLFSQLFDRRRDADERIFSLVSATAMVTLLTTMGIGSILLKKPEFLLSGGVSALVFGIIVLLSLRFHKASLGGIVIASLMIVLMIPANFFHFGGIAGGAPLWFTNYLLYVALIIKGKFRNFFAVLGVAVFAACTVLTILKPEWVRTYSDKERSYIIIASAAAVGFMVFAMVGFCMYILREKIEHSEEQAKEIAELNAAQNRFFSSMSHEIRTPINTIIGLNEMILREDTSPEIREDAENIQAASKMLLQTINDILDMSKFESGEMELTNSAYRTGDMLSDIVGMLWIRAREKNLEFRVDIAPDLPEELSGDEVRIKQILINVLNNGIKYTEKGSVTLQIQCERQEGNRVKMTYIVTDTGIGIKKENIPYLFTAFKRVDEEKNRYIEGTGLGLSIVKQLVDLMKGTISVNSVYTKGTTFVIELPQTIVSNAPIGEMRASRKNLSVEKKEYRQSFEAPEANVLVVDDTAANLMVVKKLLRDTKVRLTTASSGAEALEKTLDTAFHVILMDHMMPEMDGIECMHRIRAQAGGRSNEAKIIALTANAGGDMKANYAHEGFDGYLLKPVSGNDLERELIHALPPDLVHITNNDSTILEESVAWISDHQKKIPIAVTTESLADVPKSLAEKYGIAIISNKIITKDGLFRDGIDLDTRGLINYLQDNMDSDSVKDRAPDVPEYQEFFAQALDHANHVIHIAISRKVSKRGFKAANEAAEVFDNVTIFESCNLSAGQGLMAIEASRMAKEGKTVEEILAALEILRNRVTTTFVAGNIDYLVRAKLISAGLGNIVKSLMINPVLKVKNGMLKPSRVCIGSREKVWKKFIKATFDTLVPIDRSELFIAHVGLTHQELETIKKLVGQYVQFKVIYCKEVSTTIAVNCGDGSFGFIFKRTV